MRVGVGEGFLKDYLRWKMSRQCCVAVRLMVVGIRVMVRLWMMIRIWMVFMVVGFVLVLCVMVGQRWRWWEMVVGTNVEGLREGNYLVGLVWNWNMVSWFLGKVGVVVMVVVVGSRMG